MGGPRGPLWLVELGEIFCPKLITVTNPRSLLPMMISRLRRAEPPWGWPLIVPVASSATGLWAPSEGARLPCPPLGRWGRGEGPSPRPALPSSWRRGRPPPNGGLAPRPEASRLLGGQQPLGTDRRVGPASKQTTHRAWGTPQWAPRARCSHASATLGPPRERMGCRVGGGESCVPEQVSVVTLDLYLCRLG